jgi:hypothetical protein
MSELISVWNGFSQNIQWTDADEKPILFERYHGPEAKTMVAPMEKPS